MKKIVGIFSPVSFQHKLFVLEDGEQIDSTITSIKNLEKSLFTLADKHGVQQIDISGPKTYCSKIKTDLSKSAIDKYSNLTINLI